MAQTKGNGNGVAEFVTGTLVNKANLVAVLVDTGADLQAEDDAYGEAVERTLSVLQPLMYVIPTASAGQIHAIVDGSQFDAASVQKQLQAIGTQVANSYDFSGATVTLGTNIVVS
jgi:hypothetical protein|tara:strand:- start:1267 stop:1611 length:345 start_codon:yes stop_codon:yes gene_type:complete